MPTTQTVLAACAGLGSAWLVYCALKGESGRPLLQLLQRRLAASSNMAGSDDEEAAEVEVPEEFQCPISLGSIQDPVLLCGSGQLYCLESLRSWLATGSRTCPKSNIALRDVQVVRLPTVRSRIAAWRQAQGLPPLPPLDPPPAVLQEAGAEVPGIMAGLRCGDVYQRGLAAGEFNDLLIAWGRNLPLTPARQQVMEALLLDLVWLMRQGDPYGSGVSAAALAQYESAGQLGFLAAVAAMPAVSLLWSPHSYGQHSAARLLGNLVHAAPRMPEVLTEAGAVRGLLKQLDVRLPFQYNRCSAAAALAGLCECQAGRSEARSGGAVPLLKNLVLQQEEPGDGDTAIRFQKRDAAAGLLALQLTKAEAEEAPAVTWEALWEYSCCSHAWLLGQAEQPTSGHSAEEAAAVALLERPPQFGEEGAEEPVDEGGA